jgi:hypothetical protein
MATRRKKERRPEDLESIPGIGPAMARDLRSLGIESTSELRGKDAQALYDTLRGRSGGRLDPCVLYTFRCAVHYASNERREEELLKWWNWKERR